MDMLIFYAVLAIGVSFLCSLLEAALLSLPASHIAMLVERGSGVGRRLESMKTRIDRPLSAILTLNTVAHTVGAAGVGAEAVYVFGHAAVGPTSAVMTFLILVLSEIIPKTLGAMYSKSLAAFTSLAVLALIFVTYPLVVMMQAINRLLGTRADPDTVSRGELWGAIRLARQAGALNPREYQIVGNLMFLDRVTLADVLTPRTVVFALPEEMTVAQVFEQHPALRFSRIPVYRGSLDDVTGYVARFELNESYRSGKSATTLAELIRPIRAIPEQASVASALGEMLRGKEHLALVVDEYGGFEGIVTLEDLIETLLGLEITDETDTAVDLQAFARELAESKRPPSGSQDARPDGSPREKSGS